jgi:hypothetical protein
MAGFQLSINGRFWVSTEGHDADTEFDERLEWAAGKLARLLLDRGEEARRVTAGLSMVDGDASQAVD